MKKIMILALTLVISSTGIFAQEKAGKKHSTEHATYYTCSMHPDVKSDKPGKCPKCGNSLTLSKKEQMKMEVMKIYSCPMHPDVTSNKPGKCSKCGAELVEKKKAEPKKSGS